MYRIVERLDDYRIDKRFLWFIWIPVNSFTVLDWGESYVKKEIARRKHKNKVINYYE